MEAGSLLAAACAAGTCYGVIEACLLFFYNKRLIVVNA